MRSSQNGESKENFLSCPCTFSVTSGTSTFVWHAKMHGPCLEKRQRTTTYRLQLKKGSMNPADAIQEDADGHWCGRLAYWYNFFATVGNADFLSFRTLFYGSYIPSSKMQHKGIFIRSVMISNRVSDNLSTGRPEEFYWQLTPGSSVFVGIHSCDVSMNRQ